MKKAANWITSPSNAAISAHEQSKIMLLKSMDMHLLDISKAFLVLSSKNKIPILNSSLNQKNQKYVEISPKNIEITTNDLGLHTTNFNTLSESRRRINNEIINSKLHDTKIESNNSMNSTNIQNRTFEYGMKQIPLNIANTAQRIATIQMQNSQLKHVKNKEGNDINLNNIAASVNTSEMSQAVLKGIADYFASYTPSIIVENQQKQVVWIQNNDRLDSELLSNR